MFNVSQCVFEETTSPHVIALPPTLPVSAAGNSTGTRAATSSSGGAIAGIVIGAIVALIPLSALVFYRLCHCRQQWDPSRPCSSVHEIDTGTRVVLSASISFNSEVGGQEQNRDPMESDYEGAGAGS